jgi:hypothetical protein
MNVAMPHGRLRSAVRSACDADTASLAKNHRIRSEDRVAVHINDAPA